MKADRIAGAVSRPISLPASAWERVDRLADANYLSSLAWLRQAILRELDRQEHDALPPLGYIATERKP